MSSISSRQGERADLIRECTAAPLRVAWPISLWLLADPDCAAAWLAALSTPTA